MCVGTQACMHTHTRTRVLWELLAILKWSNLLELSSRSSGEILTLLFSICWEETFHFWVWLSEKADSSLTEKPAFWINTDSLIQKAVKSPLVWWIQLQRWVMSWKITLHRPVKAPLHDQTQHYMSWQQPMVASYPLTNFFRPSEVLACVTQVTIVSLSSLWEWLICKPSEVFLEPFQLWSPQTMTTMTWAMWELWPTGDRRCPAEPLHPRWEMLVWGCCVGCWGRCSAPRCNNTRPGLRPL